MIHPFTAQVIRRRVQRKRRLDFLKRLGAWALLVFIIGLFWML